MQSLLDLIRSHGPLIVFFAAFAENLGFPLPALVFLVFAGCLVLAGPASLTHTFAAAVAGAMCGDLNWYLIGRFRGRGALYFFCKLSLNPDSCVGRTERLFRSRTSMTILTAKLLPGLNLVVPPLAGILRLPLWRYLILDLAGSSLWAATGLGLGLVFGAGVLEKIVSYQHGLALFLAGFLAAYVFWRVLYRRRLIKNYSVPKVDSAEVFEKLGSGDEIIVLDLRSEDAFLKSDIILPGSVRIPPADFDRQVHLIPREKEIILYCT